AGRAHDAHPAHAPDRAPAQVRQARPLPCLLPARAGPRGGLLPRRAFEAGARRRPGAAQRQLASLQPFVRSRHRLGRPHPGTPLAHTVSPEAVIGWAKDFGQQWWAPLVVVSLYTPACLVMFPRPLITLASVIAFGPWLGFIYSLLGICASAVVTYYIGRRMKRDTVRRLAGPKLDRMINVLKRYGLLAMTLLRLVPI